MSLRARVRFSYANMRDMTDEVARSREAPEQSLVDIFRWQLEDREHFEQDYAEGIEQRGQ